MQGGAPFDEMIKIADAATFVFGEEVFAFRTQAACWFICIQLHMYMSQGLEFLASTYQPFSFCLTSNSMCGSMLICFRSCQGRDFYFYTWRQKAR